MNIQFVRIQSNPILKPNPMLSWEVGGVLSPAVIYENETWKMLYRAYGQDQVSRLGYAESNDGLNWRKYNQPRVVPDKTDLEHNGIEDPRIVKIGDKYYITYTAYNRKRRFVKTRIRILQTTDFKTFKRITPTFRNHFRKNDKDGVLFPEKVNNLCYMLHRLEPSIQVSSSKNLRSWHDHATILRPTDNAWESYKIGAGTPPIKTSIGWLLFYHGVSKDYKYSMSAAVVDIHKPSRVLYRLPFPLLKAETDYEKTGTVANVVFGTSVIEVGEDYRLYYGAGDKVIAAATINKSDLITTLQNYPV